MRNREKVLLMSWQERRVLLYAFLLLNSLRLALRFCSFGQVRRWIEAVLSDWVSSEQAAPIPVDFIVWAVSVAAYYTPGGAKCLVRALTAQLLLNRYRHTYAFHIGVAKADSQLLEAHAWIEYQGRIIVGRLDNLSRYKSLAAVGVER